MVLGSGEACHRPLCVSILLGLRVSSKNVPLDPREIAEIDDIVSVIDDPIQRRRMRNREVRKLQDKANLDAAKRQVFRNALEQTQRNGDPDPAGVAALQAEAWAMDELRLRRFRATQKRGQDASRKHADKVHRRREKASKSANPNRRRFPQRDRDYVDIVGKAEKGEWLNDRPLVLREIEKKLGSHRLDHWEKTSLPLKVMAMSVVCSQEASQTINLRINPDVRKKALASSRGAASFMQDNIRKALERTFGKDNAPDFWFVIESDHAGTFHLHGAVITPPVVNGLELVDKALRSAGGAWAASGGQQHQQLAVDLYGPLNWASYVCKHMNITGTRIDRKLMASTRGMSERASAAWNDIRATLPQSA